MKKLSNILKVCIVIAFALAATGVLHAQVNSKPFVVPEVTSWTGGEGMLTLSGRVVSKSAQAKSIASALVNDYKELTGGTLTLATSGAKQGDVVIEIKKSLMKQLGDEGYTIAIGNKRVDVAAATAKGAFWATRTLLQLSEQYGADIPKGKITDIPQYGLRGFMIDCGRKFIPMDYLHKLTKMMAYYKMNTLQVHLNDNGFVQFFGYDWNKTQSAFRLECDTYPGLTAKDGSYTKKEFIEFQQHAQNHFVEIIPEIDAPAHALAFTHYKPSLASKEYGMDHFDLFNPEVYDFMDGLLKEYLEGEEPVFRGPRMHIGTDEYSNAKKEVVEKFRYFTNRYINYVESFGKQAMVWGALTHAQGDTPVKADGVVMSCWYNGFAEPKTMKELGYKIVSVPDQMIYIVPGAGYYHDYLDCKWLYENWTPARVANVQFNEQDESLLGGMFAVWNDHVGNGITVKDIHHRLYPAMQTLATKCWTGAMTAIPYDEFDTKRTLLSEAPGVNELARFGKPGDVVLEQSALTPGSKLPLEEIGYNYSVTFTIDGAKEDKGTILAASNSAVVYLADPKDGKLAFEREGLYINTFNYTIPEGKTVTIGIEGDNQQVKLYVNGKLHETLGKKRLVTPRPQDLAHNQVEGASPFTPMVYDARDQIYYHHTLVFPLRTIGNFNSTIRNFKVTVK